MVRVEYWMGRQTSLYAIVCDGVNLPDAFLEEIHHSHPDTAFQMSSFLDNIITREIVRPTFLRTEVPNEGIYAMYNHYGINRSSGYCPGRLLCSYVTGRNNILIIGGGTIKDVNKPIQEIPGLFASAKFLADVMRLLSERIAVGEVVIKGNQLHGLYPDSLYFQ